MSEKLDDTIDLDSVAVGGELDLAWAVVTPVGLTDVMECDFEIWQADGQRLLRVEKMLPWVLGDWINYGEAKWGEKYSQALTDTDYSYSRLTTFSYVCRRIDFSRRRQELSFGHHEVVAPLIPDTQDVWLQRAVSHRWSIRNLIDALADRPAREDSDVWWLYQLRDLLEKIRREAGASLRERLAAIVTIELIDKLIQEMMSKTDES
jgi:hypothetical protein